MPRAASVLWLRRDLRRGDLPALGEAASAADGGNVLVLFVLDPALWDGGGPARRAWLAATLEATREAYDGRLCLRVGDPRKIVPATSAAESRNGSSTTRSNRNPAMIGKSTRETPPKVC